MNDISGISGTQKPSHVKVSLESTQKQPHIESTSEMQFQKFEMDMEEINQAFRLANEIHDKLKSALNDLS